MAQGLPVGLRGFVAGQDQAAAQESRQFQNFGQALGMTGQLMQVQDMARARQDEEQMRQLFRESGGDLKTMRDKAYQSGFYKQGMQFDQSLRKQQEEDLKRTELVGKIGEQERKRLAAVNDSMGAAYEHAYTVYQTLQRGKVPEPMARAEAQKAWAAARGGLAQDPLMQGAQLPEEFDPDRALLALNQSKRAKEIFDRFQKEDAAKQTRANAPFIAGPDGTPMPNKPVQDYQMTKSRAGAPVTNISVSTEKKYGEQFAGKVADADVLLRDAAQKSPEIADRSNRIIAALDSGKVITGTGADARLAIGKALGLAGGSDQETIANTEMLGRELAAGTLAAIRTSGLGAGNGFSNADREFLAKAEGGTLSMDAQTLRRAAQLAHKAAMATSQRWNKRVNEIPRSAVEGTGISMEPVQVAPLSGSPTRQEFNSMPDPGQYTGRRIKSDDGTIYKSDGKRWVRGG